MPPKAWTTRSSKSIYQNKWMQLREDIAELPDGRTTIYGVVTFGDCVGVLPFVDADHVVLCRQYRYIFGENHRWEMPTGGIKVGETPEAAALRELQEEVCYTAQRLEWISTYYTSKSVCVETAHSLSWLRVAAVESAARRHRRPGDRHLSLRRGAGDGQSQRHPRRDDGDRGAARRTLAQQAATKRQVWPAS
jgi:8-oxo-dGTP pyrophosphatase MutT (NUDIX family)